MTVLSLLNPFGWFSSARAKLTGGQQPGQSPLGDAGSSAGIEVGPDLALSVSAYWACVKLIGQTIGTLPCELFDQAPNGSRTAAIDDPLWDLLHDQPNADQTAVEFWESVGGCLAVFGDFYAEKLMIGSRLVALQPLAPWWMVPRLQADGSVLYRYTENGKVTDYGAEQLFHVRGFNFFGPIGLRPIVFGREALGTALAAQQAAGSLFRNGMRSSGFFRWKGPGVLTKAQQDDVRQAIIQPLVGAGNAGKIGMLPGEFDWVATVMSAIDAQMIDVMKFSVEEICRFLGVPPIMIGHSAEGQTMWGTGAIAIILAFLTTGLRPYLHRIEAAVARDIIGRARRKTLKVAFNTDELMRGDPKLRADVECQLANNGIVERNVFRAGRNLPPVEGGDMLTVQSALIPIDKLGEIARLPKDKPVEPGADIATAA